MNCLHLMSRSEVVNWETAICSQGVFLIRLKRCWSSPDCLIVHSSASRSPRPCQRGHRAGTLSTPSRVCQREGLPEPSSSLGCPVCFWREQCALKCRWGAVKHLNLSLVYDGASLKCICWTQKKKNKKRNQCNLCRCKILSAPCRCGLKWWHFEKANRPF